MLLWGAVSYLIITLGIGLWAARRVKNASDYLMAGRQLGLGLSTATLFSTWFGSETVLGASSQMAEGGMRQVIEDPFGSALCLVLIGLFFAPRLYNLNLTTFGDFYRERFGKRAELVAGLMLVLSYFGWVAAQFVAIGLILTLMTGLETTYGMLMGTVIVVGYTFYGGMWSVAVLDFIQSVMIVFGLGAAVVYALTTQQYDVIPANLPPDFFNPLPDPDLLSGLNWLAAWITIGLGSLPQQDVFQRVMSAKSEKTAVRAAYIGSGLYLTVGFLPLILAVWVRAYHPELMAGDSQYTVLRYLMVYTPDWIQLLFYGSLLSAIMSTASGAILAPASIISENLLVHRFAYFEGKLLSTSRWAVLLVALCSLGLALGGQSIYELVSESSALSLVSLFAPLVAGLWFAGRASEGFALGAMIGGLGVWLLAMAAGTVLNPLLYGLAFSAGVTVVGLIFFPKPIKNPETNASGSK